ncbi:unnamed protein product [Prorocentrum cordatum]|uniref:Uncharacterized protein n=1 Tax=Prorocentrum cordatum TaxID=2364126 RepID=A0ABN9XPU7_9DINO|nr:unnamed protein product [Polarella glacialis]
MAPSRVPMAGADLDAILKLLPTVEEIPSDDRAMFVAGLPHALAQSPESRHDFQAQFAGVAREALAGAVAVAEARVLRCGADVEAARAAQDAGDALCREAAAASEAAGKVVEDKSATREAHHALVARLEQEHAEAQAREAVVVEARDKLRAEQAELAAVLEDFRCLSAGSCQGDGRDTAAEAVQAYAKAHGVEPALVAALPAALKAPPEARGAFEALALDSYAGILSSAKAQQDSRLAAGMEEEADAVAEALGLWALHDEERQAELEARVAVGEAKVALEAAAAAEKQAAAAEREGGAEMTRRLVEQTLADEQCSQLKRALEALDRLIYGACAEPEPEAAVGAKAAEHARATANPFGVPTPMV